MFLAVITTVYVRVALRFGVPEMRAVPLLLSTKVRPDGSAPDIVISAVGLAIVRMVKLNGRLADATAKELLVIDGTRPTLSVNAC